MKKHPSPKRIQLELSRKHCEYVAERAAEYGSASKFVGELVRRDRAARAEERARIEALALEGIRSGPALPEDPEFFAKLRARVHAKAKTMRRRKPTPAKSAKRRK
ncbi:MAG: hypothetical protein NTY35_05260 [Planctomycetota bacterium]|nr:hypothetical protein [Planctomycetota bacterium]